MEPRENRHACRREKGTRPIEAIEAIAARGASRANGTSAGRDDVLDTVAGLEHHRGRQHGTAEETAPMRNGIGDPSDLLGAFEAIAGEHDGRRSSLARIIH